jgi:hypothetical protein
MGLKIGINIPFFYFDYKNAWQGYSVFFFLKTWVLNKPIFSQKLFPVWSFFFNLRASYTYSEVWTHVAYSDKLCHYFDLLLLPFYSPAQIKSYSYSFKNI